jgi:hypothetical protein
MLAEAKKYRAFARISLELAEEAETRHIRDGLIELSRMDWLCAHSRCSTLFLSGAAR